jgi:hypothetical protein
MHWKKWMDPKEFLFAFDLDGRDVNVTITHCTPGELTGEQGRKTKKPIAHLQGTPKKLALNATNCTTIEQLTGIDDPREWKNVRVVLFPTKTNFGGKTVDCIRIRPYPPKDREAGRGARSRPSDAAQRSMKEAGMLDETDKERVARIESEWHEDGERRKAIAERVLGRTLTDDEQLTDDEERKVREALAADESDVPHA